MIAVPKWKHRPRLFLASNAARSFNPAQSFVVIAALLRRSSGVQSARPSLVQARNSATNAARKWKPAAKFTCLVTFGKERSKKKNQYGLDVRTFSPFQFSGREFKTPKK